MFGGSGRTKRLALCAAAAVLTLAACETADDAPAPAPVPAPAPPPPPPPATITGTVATGAALAGARITITDRTGAAACTEPAPLIADAAGAYACTLRDTAAAPLAIVAVDPRGLRDPMISIAVTAPPAGQSKTANVTHLTTGMLGQFADDGNPLTLIGLTPGSNPSYGALTARDLQAAALAVAQQLSALLQAAGLTPSQAGTFDPIGTPFTAGTGTGIDAVLDQLRVAAASEPVNGRLVMTIANAADPNATPVPLASASVSSQPQPLSAALAPITHADLQVAREAFARCFARPASERVVARDDTIPEHLGGPTVTSLHADCSGIAHANFFNLGRTSGQYFYAALTNPEMDGAVFDAPELMRVLPDDADGNPRALVNFRYADRNGFGGNYTLVMKRFPGSGASGGRASDWWQFGNQRFIEAFVRASLSRREQLASFSNLAPSRYETGIEIFITLNGPGSRNAAGELLRAARVTGPGLPQNGLVFARPAAGIATDQTWLNIANKDGDINVTSAGDYGTIFRVQRARIDGSALNMPNQGNSNRTQYPQFAHPLDYANGQLPAISSLGAFNEYSFELFYGTETTPSRTFTTLNVSPVLAATVGPYLQWNTFTPQALAYLSPAAPQAAAAASFDLSWNRTALTTAVRNVGVYTRNSGTIVNNGLTRLPSATVTSITVNAPAGFQFQALTADGASNRTLQLRLQTMDGSYRDQTAHYN